VEYTTLGYTHYLNAQDHLVLDAGYRQKTQQAQFDYGFGFGDYNDTDIETFSFTPRLLLNRTVLGRPTAYTLGLDLYSHDYASDRSNFKANIHQPIHHIDVDQDSSAAYVQAIIDATEHTQVNAGWRLQHVKQVAHDRYDATAPGAAFGSEAGSFDKSDTEDSYELAVRHQIASGLSVYARHDRSVRFGTVDELFEFDSFFQQVFSPLTPQISKNYEVGGQLQFGLAEANLAIFHQDVRNEIYFDPIAFQNVNLDDTRHDGVEISLTHHFSEAFKLTTGYTYLDVEFTDGSNEDNEVPLIPKHSYNVTADGLLFGQVNYAVSYNYVSARYFDNDASNDFGQRIPSYQTVDLKLATDIQKLNLSLLVNNLFDEKYYTYGVRSTFTAGRYNAYPIAERTVYITASYTF
jgi:iron complex outermembrane receptor protein